MMSSIQMSVSGDLLRRFLDAASTGDVQTVSLMISQSRELLNRREEQGWSALMLAARNGHYDVAKVLLCDTSVTNRSGQTALDVALFWGHRHIARLLSSNPDHDLRQLLPNRGVEDPDIYFNREILDRMSDKRNDAEWLAAKRAAPETVFLLFHALNPLVCSGADEDVEEVRLCKLRSAAVQELLTNSQTIEVFLGVKKQEDDGLLAWFALSTEDDPTQLLKDKEPNSFFLQGAMPGLLRMSDDDADPVVIMLVLHPDGNQCLLGRKKIFPPKMFSCLAGFVEPGETLEAAVRREVREESGIQVGPVQYLSCQAWPMPSCLMIGCHCVATTTDIKVDQNEIEEARWFTRQQVMDALVKDKRAVFIMPPRQAIAHYLLKHWTGCNANL
ncbi:peroxisomal NADH pyrophosphatase NUDT12 [Labeo rohita]|uniref:NAD-capped RNA hydrolase NUDT12 n=1 Tax=Labeo rohita TaxID=84645 RepID=A0A498NEB5_LABRO|nr:peroxisomal NADH pyrophosphatase NUDT12 [Labeo rohita]